jgi:hypothetical protein
MRIFVHHAHQKMRRIFVEKLGGGLAFRHVT